MMHFWKAAGPHTDRACRQRGTEIAVRYVKGGLMLSSVSKPGRDQTSAATIFVVEDDPAMSRTFSKALEASGHRVFIASTGAEARALFDKVQPDLILLDLMLPDADGLSLTSTFQRLTSAPIVICSARHGQIDRTLGLRLGAADFVAKPFELDELEARLEALLRRSRQSGLPLATDEILVRQDAPRLKLRVRRDRQSSGANNSH
jgi:DNA-binding response OmpR family regulator